MIDYENNRLVDKIFKMYGKLTRVQFHKIINYFKLNMDYKKIHIVGTNGKGSCTKYISDSLIKSGKKVGTFTSPHLVRINERILINNEEISTDELEGYLQKIQNKFGHYSYSFFDMLFIAALMYFEDKGLDVVVIEAGIGANKDITTGIKYNWCLITSISLDHIDILGNTLNKIARDKSFAIKKGTKGYISGAIDDKLLKVFKERSNLVEQEIEIVDVNNENFITINSSLVSHFLKKEFGINQKEFVNPRGRVEKVVLNGVECYVDVAHNQEGIISTIKYFKQKGIEFDKIFVSLSKDKDVFKIFKELRPYKNIYVYENKGPKPMLITQYPYWTTKINNLQNFVKENNSKVLFIGSFYLIGEVLKEV